MLLTSQNGESDCLLSMCHGDFSMFRKPRNYRQAYWWPRCGAYARSTGLPCQRKVERNEDGRPARCWNHGGAPGSGKQTESGRRAIGESASRRMKAFWADWKAKGSPPIVRGCVRVGQPKDASAVTARPKRRKLGKPMDNDTWLRAIGVLKD